MSLQLQIINIPEGELLAESSFQVPPSGGVLGRATDNLVALPDSARFLSGQHARIFQEDGEWLIEDLSTNGLLINSSVTPLGAGKKQTLSDGDILTLGDYRILVNLFSPKVSLTPLDEPEDVMDFSNDFMAADRTLNFERKSLDLGDPFLESGDLTERREPLAKQAYEPTIEKDVNGQDIADIDEAVIEQQSRSVKQRDEQLINVFSEVPDSIPDRAEDSPLEPLADLQSLVSKSEERSPVAEAVPVGELVSVHSEVLDHQLPAIDLLYQLREENEKLKTLLRKRERQKNRQVQHCMTEALEQTLMDFAPAYLEQLFDDYSGGKGGFFSRRDNWKLYERHFQRMMKEQTPKLSFMGPIPCCHEQASGEEFMSRLKLLMVIVYLISLTGCSVLSSGQKEAAKATGGNLKLILSADHNLNPNDRGEAAPLKIRVYELAAADLFSQADFLDLYDQDSATLQDSLIKVHRIPVQYPGQTNEINLTLNDTTRFIGVLAEFSRYQEADARGVAVVRPDRSHIGHLVIEGNRLFFTLKPELTVIDQAKTLWQWSKEPDATIKQKLPQLPDQQGGSKGQN